MSTRNATAIDSMLYGQAHKDAAIKAPVKTASEYKDEGIEVSDIMYKPVEWFRENPENEVFRPLKDAAYFDALEKDIRETGAVISPLLAMPDGLLIEGESRTIICRKLLAAGDGRFRKLPVRIVLSAMSADEQRKRLYLGNLSRFRVDENTRLALYARIWPGYYLGQNEDTEEKSPTRAEIAAATGKSERQVKRDAAIVRSAAETAKTEGREAPTPQDISTARSKVNEERREIHSAKKAEQPAVREETNYTVSPKKQNWLELRKLVEKELGLKEMVGAWTDGAIAALDAVEKHIG